MMDMTNCRWQSFDSRHVVLMFSSAKTILWAPLRRYAQKRRSVGYDKGAQRYVLRLITNGVESDVALKEQNFSILKPKLLGSMVQIKGLQSKPELNGRYGFVDEFLRENERYRVFVPDRPGIAQALALKSDNLEKAIRTPLRGSRGGGIP